MPYRWLVFGLVALGYLLVYFHRSAPAVVSVELARDLATDGAGLGLLGAAYFYAYALMQPAAGILADNWGPRFTVATFFTLAGLGSLALGWAPTLGWAVAARVAVGAGTAMHFVCMMKILTRWFPTSRFGPMMGIFMAVGGVGVYSAATPLAWLAGWLGWRGAFVVIGALTLLLAGLVWLLVRNRPEDMGLPAPEDTSQETPAAPPQGLRRVIKMVLATPSFWPLACWYFCSMAFFFSFSGLWAGHWLRQVYEMSRNEAGGVLAMVALGMIVGSPLVAWLSQSVLRSRKRIMIGSSAITLVTIAPLVWYNDAMSPAMLYTLLFITGANVASVTVVGFTSIKEIFAVDIAGTASGLLNIFPFAGGAVLPPVVGWLLERAGKTDGVFGADAYAQAFAVYLVCTALALGAACLMKETHPARAGKGG